jgi:NAD(P)-dependent dehydrogenase (short-subunit alcohol dehydrogenase family)
MTLDKRTALVTGAGRGIGREIALGLARAGARVAVLARSADQIEETARLARDAGGEAKAVRADVADPDARAAALSAVEDAYGPVEILVNNAAVAWPLGNSATVDPAEWAAALNVNVTAVAALSFAVLPAMLERGWGRIVNISSGVVAHPGTMIGGNAYATTKAALEAHTVNLAAELDGTGVTVNAYRPGAVDTAMQEWIRSQDEARIPQLHQRFHRMYREGELLTPQESAGSLLTYLDSADTGQIWSVKRA